MKTIIMTVKFHGGNLPHTAFTSPSFVLSVNTGFSFLDNGECSPELVIQTILVCFEVPVWYY